MKIYEILSKFKDVYFDDEVHVYNIRGSSVKLTSATGYIDKHTEPFKEDYWSKWKTIQAHGIKVFPYTKITVLNRLVKKHRLEDKVEALKIVWKLEGQRGSSQGSYIHDVLQHAAHNRHNIAVAEPEGFVMTDLVRAKIKWGKKFLTDNPHLICVASELVIADEGSARSGMIDLLMYNILTKEYEIWDWKTDKEEKFNKKAYGKLKKPLNKVPNDSLGKYTVQLNYYRSILKLKGIEVTVMAIVHLHEHGYDVHYLDKIKTP